MNKNTEKILGFVGIFLFFLLCLWMAHLKINKLKKELDAYKNAPADTVTVVMHDTIKIAEPVPVYKYIKEKEYVTITDSLLIHDTVTHIIELPREYLVYKDTSYRAVVSGVQPRLDSIEIYQKNTVNTITKYVTKTKKTKFGIGVQAGYGYNGNKWSPYLGAGVQYNIISW